MNRQQSENHSAMTDEQLAEQSRGDIHAFAHLIRRFEGPLLQYITRISHFQVDRAEDILQEVFLKVWHNLDTYDPKHKFSCWIYRIAHNETISEFRKSNTRKEMHKMALENPRIEGLPSRTDICDDLNKKMASENISRLLDMLQPQYRTILMLKFLEDKNYEEISRQLNIPLGTVATLVHRAKRELRGLLKREKEGIRQGPSHTSG